jgi:hypothetical protein
MRRWNLKVSLWETLASRKASRTIWESDVKEQIAARSSAARHAVLQDLME